MGNNGCNSIDGGRYNPANDSWTAVTTSYARARSLNGGVDRQRDDRLGWLRLRLLVERRRAIQPRERFWTAVTTIGAPAARDFHTAVWTGSEMIVWGGLNGSSPFNDGGRYNPAANSWMACRTAARPPRAIRRRRCGPAAK